MGIEITVSPEGQIVLPQDVREALGIEAGATLTIERVGNRLILDRPAPPRERISYEEFRRRVPKYEGPPVKVEDMTSKVGDLFKDWDG